MGLNIAEKIIDLNIAIQTIQNEAQKKTLREKNVLWANNEAV